MNNEQIKKQAEDKIKELQLIIDKLNTDVPLPSFEVGKWYRSNDNQLINVSEFKLNNVRGYGFGNDNTWFYNSDWCGNKSYRSNGVNYFTPANDQEVEDALIKEAVKRGFKEGVTIDKIIAEGTNKGNKPMDKCYGRLSYTPIADELAFNNYTIYEKGQWATIIEDKIEIGGYEVRVHMVNSYKIGCKTIRKQDLFGLNNMMIQTDTNEIMFGGFKITRDTIEKILALKPF